MNIDIIERIKNVAKGIKPKSDVPDNTYKVFLLEDSQIRVDLIVSMIKDRYSDASISIASSFKESRAIFEDKNNFVG